LCCERIEKASKAGWVSGTEALQNLGALVSAAHELKSAREGLSKSFLQKLAGSGAQLSANQEDTLKLLLAAINELLALMTPARWAYRDIGLKASFKGEAPLLAFNAEDGARADLMLNTAELSAFSLALFLLLAPRVGNPLQLLILDDPLQNMDEMMVTTLARALASLMPVYPEGWSVLALFHGQEDIERISDEADSVLYYLPWLRPFETEKPEGQVLQIRPKSTNGQGQKLNSNLFIVVKEFERRAGFPALN
jgi:hypothetical protein